VPFLRACPQGRKLRRCTAAAQPNGATPAAQDVEQRDLFGDDQRLVQVDADYGAAQPDLPRPAGQVGGEGERRRQVTMVDVEMVFGEPDVRKAECFSVYHLPLHVGVALGRRLLRRAIPRGRSGQIPWRRHSHALYGGFPLNHTSFAVLPGISGRRFQRRR